MARSVRIAVVSGAAPVRIDNMVGDLDREYGSEFLVYNSGTVTVELGGSDISSANSFRGLTAGASAGLTLADNEELYARVTGATSGSIDVLRTK